MGLSLVGIALANFIPQAWGLGFAGVLSLVAIVCSMATTRLRVLAALVAGATAVAAYALPLKLNIVVGIGVAVLLCFWLEKQLGLDPACEDDAMKGADRCLDAGRDRRPGRRDGAHALLLLHPRPALGPAGVGASRAALRAGSRAGGGDRARRS